MGSMEEALDGIRNVDPRQYRDVDIRVLVNRIVDEYIALSYKCDGSNDIDRMKRQLDRSRLFSRNSELFCEKGQEF